MTGCVSSPLSEVQEYNRQIDIQNWVLCEAVYERANTPTVHYGHTHRRHMSVGLLADAVKDDLIQNRCRGILKDYWADHI